MDDARLGTALRKLRFERGWTQAELADRAGVSQSFVSRTERGKLGSSSIGGLRALADALDARIDIRLLWHGGDLDRLLNRRHSAMHEIVARLFSSLPEWVTAPEVSYAIYGERGTIDILAWHAASAVAVVIELKTEIVDIQELIGKLDQKRRLAPRIAAERGWAPRSVGALLIVAESRTNRRRVATHATVLRSAFPGDGRSVSSFLRRPDAARPFSALFFLPNSHPTGLRGGLATPRRVRKRGSGTRNGREPAK